MMETFESESLILMNTNILNFISSGKISGCSVEFGQEITNCVCMYEGTILKSSKRFNGITGDDLTSIYQSELKSKGFDFDFETSRILKEKVF